MFDRLIEALGTISTQDDAVQLQRAETQLATAILLYAVVPADRITLPEEMLELHSALIHIFSLSDEAACKLIAEASDDYQKEPTLLAPATLLKHRLSFSFRNLIMSAAKRIAIVDGSVHENEADVLRRIEILLGLSSGTGQQRKSA